MPVIQPVDLTKPRLDWRWLISFFLIIVVLLLVIGLGMWLSNAIKTAVTGPAGSKRRVEEPRI